MPAIAKLRKLHISPRKTNLVAALIRRMNAEKALKILERTPNRSAAPIAKLLKSAIANYQAKEGQSKTTPEKLYIQTIYIGSAGMLKRIKPAPRGTAHRIRKRMTHITLIIDKEISSYPPTPSKKVALKKNKEASRQNHKKIPQAKARETTTSSFSLKNR